MNTVLKKLYPHALTTEMSTRLSNSILIGDIFGVRFLSLTSSPAELTGRCCSLDCAVIGERLSLRARVRPDGRLGRRWGIVGCTFFLVAGVTLATAAHGKTPTGMLWMVVVSAHGSRSA